jgi:tyrosinase-like protein/polyphenol oxidase-like protein
MRTQRFISGTHRRLSFKFWFGLHLCALILLLESATVHAQTQRKSVTDLTATELMSLRRGVANMMARNGAPHDSADFRRSWIYWANMHDHFGDDCEGPIVGTGMGGVQTFIASNADETATWCRCEHGTVQFLTWHRMYLWYFERVLQEAAGDPSLRLPYWDYETEAHLPAAYRDASYVDEQGQTVPNPLRVSARRPSLNNGTGALSSFVTSTATAMTDTTFSPFNSDLEQTPHGAVHCAITTGGCPNGGLMGSVPAAALDPIFYAHHTNIDRLYECWLQGDEPGRLPSDPTQLNTVFTFVDADGSTVDRRVSDMLTTTQLGYTYTAGGGCPPSRAEVSRAAENRPMAPVPEQVLASVGPTRLDPTVTTVPLAMSPQGRQALVERQGVPTSSRTYVTIEGLQYDEAPGVLYNVFLRGAGEKREQIGVINFFNLSSSRSADHTGRAGHVRTRGSFRFDITDAVKQLDISGDAPLSLVFEPTTGLSDSSPETVAQEMNPQASVRFESAQLVTAR